MARCLLFACERQVQPESHLDYAWWEKRHRSGTAPTAPSSEDWKEVAPWLRVTQKLQNNNQQPYLGIAANDAIDLPADLSVA